MDVSVCIFARNEARHLPRCIAALNAGLDALTLEIHILVNGCSDDTAQVAATLAAADPKITVHELPVGDKAHAWNEYVHRLAGDAATHVFLDGDIRPGPGAIPALARALHNTPLAYGAAALPASGRSRRYWAAQLLENNYLSGNLYALSQAALARFRAEDIRLPFGAKGEDGLISYLLLTNFAGGEGDHHKNRITAAPGATFEFDPLTFTPRDAAIYARRLRRYSERHFQKSILYPQLKARGVSAMPDNIHSLYTKNALHRVRPRRDPVNYWFDAATLRRLKRNAHVSARRSALGGR